MDRNIRLYPWFQVTANAYFWMPVFFLYFSAHLPLRQVLALEAVYYAAVVLLEVPSGYFSDRVGRRPTLVISGVTNAAAMTLFFLGDGFAVFAAAQVALAASLAFQSGTDVSIHFDSLHAAGRDGEYADREAVATRMAALSSALAALAGGVAASIALRNAYALTFIVALAQIGIAVALVEPPRDDDNDRVAGFAGQIGRCVAALGRAPLPWLFAFAVAAYALNHVPYHLAQPYTDLLLGPAGPGDRFDAAPLVLGLLTALVMWVRSAAAGMSVRLRDRIGLRGVLLGSFALQAGIVAACGAVLHPLILGLLLLRSAPTGLQRAPLVAAILPNLPRTLRATYLSLQSLAGRLLYSAALLALAHLAAPGAETDWVSISRMALVAAGAAGAVLVGLAVTGRK